MKKLLMLLSFVSLTTNYISGSCDASCHHKDGTVDVTFGNHGKVTTEFGTVMDAAQGVTVTPCGTIVAVGFRGETFSGPFSMAMAGYTSYGALDNDNFGTNGKVIIDAPSVLTDAGVPDLTVPGQTSAAAIALQKNCKQCNTSCGAHCDECDHNCKLVVAGSSTATPTQAAAFTVMRFHCDGTPDTTFGINNSGITVTSINGTDDEALALAVQKDGKIVVVGFTAFSDGSHHFAIVRYNCDGTLDKHFGCDKSGKVVISFGGSEEHAQAVQIQKDGKIVVTGTSGIMNTFPYNPIDSNFATVRLTTDGALDKTFGDNGKVLTDFGTVFGTGSQSNDRPTSLVLMEGCDDACNCCADKPKIVVAGSTDLNDSPAYDFALAGYLSNGELDPNFGDNGNGLVVTQLVSGADDKIFAAILQKKCCAKPCKIIVGGVTTSQTDLGNWALVRYNGNGTIDRKFGTNGMVITDFNHDEDSIQALALQKNGYIIAAGRTNPGIRSLTGDFGLMRYRVCTPCCCS